MDKPLRPSPPQGTVIWLTGLPGSGKTAIAQEIEGELRERGHQVEVLDGDFIRKNLSPELGFSKEDRETHNKRVIFISKLLSRNGVVVIVPLISPYRAVRDYARKEVTNFVEIYVKCAIEECIRRDPKGLYKKALRGEIKDMTGIQDPYEEPLNPELVVNTDCETLEQSAGRVLQRVKELGYL